MTDLYFGLNACGDNIWKSLSRMPSPAQVQLDENIIGKIENGTMPFYIPNERPPSSISNDSVSPAQNASDPKGNFWGNSIDDLLITLNRQKETTRLWGLKPNTKYAFYVKAIVTKTAPNLAQSGVTYFVTKPDRE